MKLKLFQRIKQVLNPGGCFWNADPTPTEATALQPIYQQVKEDWTLQQGSHRAEIQAKLGSSDRHGHSSHDHLASLTTHLEMLQQASFQGIEVPWKYFELSIFGGYA